MPLEEARLGGESGGRQFVRRPEGFRLRGTDRALVDTEGVVVAQVGKRVGGGRLVPDEVRPSCGYGAMSG